MPARRLTAAAIASTLFPGLSFAHEWYPYHCCSEKDCYEISADMIVPLADGWLIKETGEIVPYGKTRTTPLEAGNTFHRCALGGDRTKSTIGSKNKSGNPWCFWAPPMGM